MILNAKQHLLSINKILIIVFFILESTMLFASHGDQIGLAKLVQGYRLSNSDGHYISTKGEGRKAIKLKVNEIVLQVISSTPLDNVYNSFLTN